MTFNPGLYDKLPYDPVRDFAPVTMLGSFPLVLGVNPALPAQSVKELVALAKAQPGKLNYAAGSTPFQLAAELFKQQADVRIEHIPYKGSVATVTAVVANDVQLTFMDAPPVDGADQIRQAAGARRHLAHARAGAARGADDDRSGSRQISRSCSGPACSRLRATPKPVLDAIHAQAVKALQHPEVRERMAGLGIEPVGNTPAELGAILKSDLEKWTAVAKSAGVKAE